MSNCCQLVLWNLITGVCTSQTIKVRKMLSETKLFLLWRQVIWYLADISTTMYKIRQKCVFKKSYGDKYSNHSGGHIHHCRLGRRPVPYITIDRLYLGGKENWFAFQLPWPPWAPRLLEHMYSNQERNTNKYLSTGQTTTVRRWTSSWKQPLIGNQRSFLTLLINFTGLSKRSMRTCVELSEEKATSS